jgi:hypothetical protein
VSATLKESTWRERQEAKAAVAEALHQLTVAQMAAEEARQAYYDAMDREKEAVQRNIDAWHSQT